MEELEQRVEGSKINLRGAYNWGYNTAAAFASSPVGSELMFGFYLMGQYIGIC